MPILKSKIVLTTVSLLLLLGGPVNATPLNPSDFTSLGAMFGDITIDTNLLTVNGSSGAVLHSQSGGGPDIAVFTFDGGSSLGNVTVTGSNAVALLFQGSGTINGEIDVSGGDGTDPGGAGIGVVGGGRGGVGGPFNADIAPDTGEAEGAGAGPGGGVLASSSASVSGSGTGSGGGFGTEGGIGGVGVTFRPGGLAYGGPLSDQLFGGSGGAGGGGFCCGGYGGGGGGGAGGGALEIGALTTLNIIDSLILAEGGDGGIAFRGGGGGSGGGIFLHAYDINIDATSLISANGGNGGGAGTHPSAGGCGGAGRISILSNSAGTINNSGTVTAMTGVGKDACSDLNVVTLGGSPDIGVASSVPEPASIFLLATGILGLGLRRKNR